MGEVILHEMGHVLGFGTVCKWVAEGTVGNDGNLLCPGEVSYLGSPSLPDDPGADTYFSGQRAIAAFDAVGGSGYSGAKVPVENLAGPGSGDSHWRESVFNTELMTPSLDGGGLNQLSIVTIEQFADIGYGVDVTGADSYTLPGPFAGPTPVSGDRRVIDLRGDVRQGPIAVVNAKGEIVKVIR